MGSPNGSAAAGAETVFDARVLTDMFGGDTAVIAGVLATFVDSMASSVSELRSAADRGDLLSVKAVAHRVKGAARMSGALALAHAALAVEQAAAKGNLRATLESVVSLAGHWDALRSDPALDSACRASPDT